MGNIVKIFSCGVKVTDYSFGWTIRMAGELESDSVALERVREYEELPQEADWHTPEAEVRTARL